MHDFIGSRMDFVSFCRRGQGSPSAAQTAATRLSSASHSCVRSWRSAAAVCGDVQKRRMSILGQNGYGIDCLRMYIGGHSRIGQGKRSHRPSPELSPAFHVFPIPQGSQESVESCWTGRLWLAWTSHGKGRESDLAGRPQSTSRQVPQRYGGDYRKN